MKTEKKSRTTRVFDQSKKKRERPTFVREQEGAVGRQIKKKTELMYFASTLRVGNQHM